METSLDRRKPLAGYRIALGGRFTRYNHGKLIKLCQELGASVTSGIKENPNLLICSKSSIENKEEKFKQAIRIGTDVVKVEWLEWIKRQVSDNLETNLDRTDYLWSGLHATKKEIPEALLKDPYETVIASLKAEIKNLKITVKDHEETIRNRDLTIFNLGRHGDAAGTYQAGEEPEAADYKVVERRYLCKADFRERRYKSNYFEVMLLHQRFTMH